MNICSNPDILSVVRVVNIMVLVIKIGVPIALIIAVMIDFLKAIKIGDEDLLKKAQKMAINRAIAAVLIFFIPTFVNVIIGIAGPDTEYKTCIENATEENIQNAYIARADEYVSIAESEQSYSNYTSAILSVRNISNPEIKKNYTERLDAVKKSIDDKLAEEKKKQDEERSTGTGTAPSGDPLSPGGYYTSSSGTCQKGVEQTYEPNPANAISCWPSVLSPSKFVYLKDDATGKSLGAWPSNYKDIPTQLTSYKTYVNGTFIVPITPVNSKYQFGYSHNGIDLAAYFGTPVYSPVDGTLVYSEWGHTSNRQGDETAYSVSINLDKPTTYDGVTIGSVFLTHLSGIRYRCNPCNRKVKKGELVGFSGNASGRQVWAPHLHMTLHPKDNYGGGLKTEKIESLYGIKDGCQLNAGG